jgi:hypothetical protein
MQWLGTGTHADDRTARGTGGASGPTTELTRKLQGGPPDPSAAWFRQSQFYPAEFRIGRSSTAFAMPPAHLFSPVLCSTGRLLPHPESPARVNPASALLLLCATLVASPGDLSAPARAAFEAPHQHGGVSVAYDPNFYASALDTEVTYDDFVAQSYDDGYGPRAFAQFEAALAPYGAWIDDAGFGRVWVPSVDIVGRSFSPYGTKGTWVLTEYGWTWASGWDWGWAPFHYGRWTILENGVWAWVPGTLWGPAWVAWRSGRDYVGWAPLPPRGVHLGRPIGTRSPWRFVSARSFGGTSLEYVPLRTVPSIFGHTAALSGARSTKIGNLSVRLSVGPSGARCCRGQQPAPLPLASAAPNALPRLTIRPRSGAPLQSRPWVAAGALEQTPLRRWPAPSGS